MVQAALELKLEEKVMRAIDDAIELSQIGGRRAASHKIAERIFDSEPKLIQLVSRPWILSRLTWMIDRRRRERWHATGPSQMVLPDPIFEGLPSRVNLRDGSRPKLDRCTLGETEQYLRMLRERYKQHPRIVQMEAVVDLHRKWSAQMKGISWGDAQRREAEERDRV